MATIDFDNTSGQTIPPMKLAHVVLRTHDFEKMRDFYLTFLGGRVQHQNEQLCFIAYDDEHHRIALAKIPFVGEKNPGTAGLEHVAFTFSALPELLLAYRQRLAKGIKPSWCVNHGITTSIYYKDPDGNWLETQVDAMEADAANDYMASTSFGENPIGVDFDPEELIARLKKGESEETILKRPDIGPRNLETVPLDFPEELKNMVAAGKQATVGA